MGNETVRLRGISHSYARPEDGEPLLVLDNLSITVNDQEFITVFGPNGCGKTTLLNIIAGLIEPERGTVEIRGNPPVEANVGFVFQNYVESLLPWKNALDNIAFPLELRNMDKKERRRRSSVLLESLGLPVPPSNYPYQLSGGQQQMVAIARALIHASDVVLMDEPFSALHFQTRLYMQDRLLDIWQKTKLAFFFVSHEIEEAIYMADRVILLSERPCRVLKSIPIPIGRPRTRACTLGEDFIAIKRDILQTLKDIAE